MPWRFLLLALALAGTRPAHAQSCVRPRTALVLSGGGAKGLAHIGVIRVLDSLGIRPDLVVGTSMGAIIGGMYASGYSGKQIDSIVRALPVSALFRSYEPRAPRELGSLRPLARWEEGEGGFTLESATVDEAQVNTLTNVAMARGNLLARGDFDSLPIPFRAVATDLADRSPVVLGSGDLAQAVRASFAVPLIFHPLRVDGRVLADGSLSANVPVAVAREAGAERVIVSDVAERPGDDSLNLYSPLGQADVLINYLFLQPPAALGPADIEIRSRVAGFRSLDFRPAMAERLIRRGLLAAQASLRPESCGAPARAVRTVPPTRLTAVDVRGVDQLEERYVLGRLGLRAEDSLRDSETRTGLRHLAASELYEAVWLNPSGSGDSVALHLSVRRATRRVAGLGIAYDNELGGRLWLGGVERRLLHQPLEGSAALFVGELRNEAYLGIRSTAPLTRPWLVPTVLGHGVLESIRRFDSSGSELPSVKTRDLTGFLGVELPLRRDWNVRVGGQGHLWREPGGPNRSAVGALVRVEHGGPSLDETAVAEGVWTAVYRRVELRGATTVSVGPVRLSPRVIVGWGQDLPLESQFPLGGDDGFPGLHLTERRGQREALLEMGAARPIRGILFARVTAVVGRSAAGGSLLGSDGWLAGVRAGLGVDTPLGPVRAEYGRNTEGRGALLVRVGRWF